MTNLLVIRSSVNGENCTSNQMTDTFIVLVGVL